MNKSILILASVLTCVMSSTGKSKTLLESLQTYCVPTSGSNCTGVSRALYNETKSACECSACNMYYDKASRTCKTCPLGTYVTDRISTECIQPTCGIGMYPNITTGDTCPSGSYATSLSSCN